MNLKGKVIFLNNRVWTIYSESTTGVYCYEGVDLNGFSSDKEHITYFDFKEIKERFLKEHEISTYMSKVKQREYKPLTKSHASQFISKLTGHSYATIQKNIEERVYQDNPLNFTYAYQPGLICYEVSKSDKHLVLSHDTSGLKEHAFFDLLTFEPVFESRYKVE